MKTNECPPEKWRFLQALFFFPFVVFVPFQGRHSLIFRGGTVIGYDMICIRTSLPKTNWKPWFGTTLTLNSLSHSPLLNLLVGDFNPLEKYQSIRIISPSGGEHFFFLKPPPSLPFSEMPFTKQRHRTKKAWFPVADQTSQPLVVALHGVLGFFVFNVFFF